MYAEFDNLLEINKPRGQHRLLMELDTGQLNSVLSKAFGSSFGGTHPRDLIPHRLRPYEKAIVVNTDPHDKPGTHWVCMYVVPPVVEYFLRNETLSSRYPHLH